MEELQFQNYQDLLRFLMEQNYFAIQECSGLNGKPVYRILRSGDSTYPDCLCGKIFRMADYEGGDIIEQVFLGNAVLQPSIFKL